MSKPPAPTLRPMLAADGPMLAAIFRASIDVLAAEDYDDGQREAWASRAEDEAAFARRLSGQLTLVAMVDGEPVGFASLAGADKLDMMFVDPDRARQGVGSLLLDALVRIARGRGATKLTVDASDAARDFFAARGFSPRMRNTVQIGDHWLGNTTMERGLTAASVARSSP